MNEFPKVMRQARVDLAGHLAGEFSPEDWDKILRQADSRLKAYQQSGLTEGEAWGRVIREFHVERQWGFLSNYKRPRPPKDENPNLGISLIWMTFTAFVLTNMAVVWTGQIYTHSEDPKDKWIFFLALTVAILNWVIFLWRFRNHND